MLKEAAFNTDGYEALCVLANKATAVATEAAQASIAAGVRKAAAVAAAFMATTKGSCREWYRYYTSI
jgi:tryptophan 2,3-dioxygenase